MTRVLKRVSLCRTLRRKRPLRPGTVAWPPAVGNAAPAILDLPGKIAVIDDPGGRDMWGSRAKLAMPSKDKALPGRSERMRVPAAHFVNRRPLTGPFQAG